MAKIPYGFEANDPLEDADSWTKLEAIDQCLRDLTPVPPGLAHWLGLAISYACRDPEELLRRLGLKALPGGNQPPPFKLWHSVATRVLELEGEGKRKEAAVSQVLAEIDDAVSRSTVKRWRADYLKLLKASRCD